MARHYKNRGLEASGSPVHETPVNKASGANLASKWPPDCSLVKIGPQFCSAKGLFSPTTTKQGVSEHDFKGFKRARWRGSVDGLGSFFNRDINGSPKLRSSRYVLSRQSACSATDDSKQVCRSYG